MGVCGGVGGGGGVRVCATTIDNSLSNEVLLCFLGYCCFITHSTITKATLLNHPIRFSRRC